MNKKIVLILGLLALNSYLCADFWPSNLFDASNILFNNYIPAGRFVEFNIIPEIPVTTKPFAACSEKDNKAHPVNNVLQIWQEQQNIAAASPTLASSAEFSNFLANHSFAEVKGNYHIPLNLMFSVRFPLGCDFYVGLYLPFMIMKLRHITWQLPDSQSKEDAETLQKLLVALDEEGSMNVQRSWNRSGIGDLTSLVGWLHTFIQERPWLRAVMVGIRGGAVFPTGKKEDLGRLFALPFGYDGGVGILGGGTLELDLKNIMKFGIDVQFTHFFGVQETWRFKTLSGQTDLLLLNKQRAVHDPGFSQFYTLYLKLSPYYWLNATLAYQHMHHHDAKLLLDKQVVAPSVIESAERLQEWTTHSLVGMLNVDFRDRYDLWYLPSLTFFAKYGFRGHRALLFDTVGLQVSFNY